MLYVKTEKGVIEMTELLIEEFSKIGLHLNASKTKILTTDVVDYEFLEIGGNMVEILHGNSTHRFLGRYLPGILENRGDVEVTHRIQAAWMKYGQFSRIFSNRKISVKLRLKLFDAIVSPTLLLVYLFYQCANRTWRKSTWHKIKCYGKLLDGCD